MRSTLPNRCSLHKFASGALLCGQPARRRGRCPLRIRVGSTESRSGYMRVMAGQVDEVVLSDTARVEAFSDGVLAIVITLLVLDLRVPAHEPGKLLDGLLDEWPTYVAFVTSFLYVGIVWLNHHAAFRRIRLVDRGLHWVNLGRAVRHVAAAVSDRGGVEHHRDRVTRRRASRSGAVRDRRCSCCR